MTDAQRAPVPLLDWNVLVTSREVVIVIEVVGDVAGVGLVTRRLREQCPFVRVD